MTPFHKDLRGFDSFGIVDCDADRMPGPGVRTLPIHRFDAKPHSVERQGIEVARIGGPEG